MSKNLLLVSEMLQNGKIQQGSNGKKQTNKKPQWNQPTKTTHTLTLLVILYNIKIVMINLGIIQWHVTLKKYIFSFTYNFQIQGWDISRLLLMSSLLFYNEKNSQIPYFSESGFLPIFPAILKSLPGNARQWLLSKTDPGSDLSSPWVNPESVLIILGNIGVSSLQH